MGRPGAWCSGDDDGAKARWELRRSREKAEMVQGTIRLERSESGWPIVDISQLLYVSIRVVTKGVWYSRISDKKGKNETNVL